MFYIKHNTESCAFSELVFEYWIIKEENLVKTMWVVLQGKWLGKIPTKGSSILQQVAVVLSPIVFLKVDLFQAKGR